MATDEDPALLRSFLLERDAPCPRCAYNLRGLSSTTCPECEYPLQLQLARMDRPSARKFGFVVLIAAVGSVYGGTAAFRLISDIVFSRIPSTSFRWLFLIAVWCAMYTWLLILCLFGLARLRRARETDKASPTVERLIHHFLWFLLANFVLGLVTNLARFFGWL